MNSIPQYVFTGQEQPEITTRHHDSPQRPEPYVASAGLIEAVNLAIHLKRPLLLEGEAGSGKTRLARAVAYELGLPFYPWYVRSTSKAQEGLYTYDAIRRLHDVHLIKAISTGTLASSVTDSGQGSHSDPGDPRNYRKLGPLGKAFLSKDCPAVVLIDEIDKADIDFPNDLLAVLDDPWMFEIPETGEVIEASQHKPIVIVTSNKEKGNLPAPFLRRCLYHFVKFPEDEEQLKRIVDKHYELLGDKHPSPELIKTAAKRFLRVRAEGLLHKRPGTSEFLDWVEALRSFRSNLGEAAPRLEGDFIPYPEVLFKLRADWHRYVMAQ